MKLVDYLKKTRITSAEFAAMVGASPKAVFHWRQGSRVPRPATMAQIIRATDGQVTANDFLPSVTEAA